jgi:hypothetical protein
MLPHDLAIPSQAQELELPALAGYPPGEDGEGLPRAWHDPDLWYPGRAVTQHILDDGERVNSGRQPRKA